MSRRCRFGRVEVHLDERIVRVDGNAAKLGARAFDLLRVLLENRPRVVGKAELLDAVWPGMVVEEGNLAVHVWSLRRILGAAAIRTVAGRGYQFTLEPEDDVSPDRVDTAQSALALPDKPSIAVLPFANLGRDRDQDAFADGITEDILTELSRFHELFVIARNSSFTYRERSVDVRRVGRELGVRYVLEGSLRRSGERVRVTAQLIDAASGSHLWAERYDRVLDDAFAVQEEITAGIVASIAPRIRVAENGKLRRIGPRSPSAYELAVRARAAVHAAGCAGQIASLACADRDATRALELEPDNLVALESLAAAATIRLQFGASPDPSATLEKGLDAVAKGLAVDAAWAPGFVLRGMLLMMSRRPELEVDAISALRRARELNPNDAHGQYALGFGELAAGEDSAAIECFERALRLSPRDPQAHMFQSGLALGHVARGDYAEALRAARRSVDAAPQYPLGRLVMAIAYGGLGEADLARSSLNAARRISPDYVERLVENRTIVHRNPRLRERALPFVRLAAGLPDPRETRA